MSWKVFLPSKRRARSRFRKDQEEFFSKIATTVAGKSKVDDEVLDNLEEVLVSSDVSVKLPEDYRKIRTKS